MSGALLGSLRAWTSLAFRLTTVLWVPFRAPPRPPKPLNTVSELVPSELSCACTACEDPLPTATTRITAPTPMSMPRVVSAERSLFEKIPWTAIFTLSRCMASSDLRPFGLVLAPLLGAAGVEAGRGAVERGLAVVLDDVAVDQPDDPLGVGGDVWLVGDHDHGAAGGVEAVEDLEHLLGGVGVEVAGGLVGQDD